MTVYLVGAGPGDPGLLTVRASELIAMADVVVHDRLVDERVLDLAPERAVRHDVGKSPGGSIDQEEINELLVLLAAEHSCVVRLKGGDPYVFGRGGEEAMALMRAGVAFEVVPGVSSVNGALAYAGIPLTHRGLSASFTVVTGHGAGVSPGDGSAPVDWDALGRLGGTVVVLMGVARRAEIADRLVAAGRDPATPAAVVSRATGPAQRTWRTTLGDLAACEPETPAIVVVGEVAGLDLAWFEARPLFGWKVVVTRAREQSPGLVGALSAAGADPVEVPTITISAPADGKAALRDALGRLHSFDWVAFTSANAVASVFGELGDARSLGGLKVAAIGRATATALSERGIEADLVPEVSVGEELAAAFGPPAAGRGRVLLPQAARAREALAKGLQALGYEVEAVPCYETRPEPADERGSARLQGADAITFASPSSLEAFLGSYGMAALAPVVVTIGPVTSKAARDHGVVVDAEAGEASVDGIVQALVRLAAERAGH